MAHIKSVLSRLTGGILVSGLLAIACATPSPEVVEVVKEVEVIKEIPVEVVREVEVVKEVDREVLVPAPTGTPYPTSTPRPTYTPHPTPGPITVSGTTECQEVGSEVPWELQISPQGEVLIGGIERCPVPTPQPIYIEVTPTPRPSPTPDLTCQGTIQMSAHALQSLHEGNEAWFQAKCHGKTGIITGQVGSIDPTIAGDGYKVGLDAGWWEIPCYLDPYDPYLINLREGQRVQVQGLIAYANYYPELHRCSVIQAWSR